jgi:hypothetical protein
MRMTLIGDYFGSRFLIYALCDPRTREVRYIGASTRGLARPRQHLSLSGNRDNTSVRAHWCRGLLVAGLAPLVRVLEEVADRTALMEAERVAISRFRALGARLLNRQGGGGGIRPCDTTSEQARCETVEEFLERARERLIRSAMREFDVNERLRDREQRLLYSGLGRNSEAVPNDR